MSFEDQPLTVVINGEMHPLGLDSTEPLVRAVIISLFSWRRARPDDDLPSNERMGWWGDTYPQVENDKIGSRLWLLSRAKFFKDVPAQAREFAEEALEWIVTDGLAAKVQVMAERIGLDTLGIHVVLYRKDGSVLFDLRFPNAWEFANAV